MFVGWSVYWVFVFIVFLLLHIFTFSCFHCIMNLMKKNYYILILFFTAMLCTGCVSISGKNKDLAVRDGYLLNTNEEETLNDAVSALAAVTGSVSEKDFSERDLYEAVKSMKNDPEARTAVEAISSAFDKGQVQIKYSPATGKRYGADIEFDPETGVKLLILE